MMAICFNTAFLYFVKGDISSIRSACAIKLLIAGSLSPSNCKQVRNPIAPSSEERKFLVAKLSKL